LSSKCIEEIRCGLLDESHSQDSGW
jgi:hypothetical protein